MSVVAWDGKILAADTLSICADLKRMTSKTMRIYNKGEEVILAWTGQVDHAKALCAWYMNGAALGDFPEFQKTADWSRLIVVKKCYSGDWLAATYEQTPFPIPEPAPMAWGSGRDYALGAMAKGANAKEAVEIACSFASSCGLPVEFYEVCK